jgi:hypothetical protein
MKGQLLLRPDASCPTDYPEAPLREWAAQTLGAQRCSAKYLMALRIVLGNMSRADRHGAMLQLTTTAAFAPRQTMRTLLDQLVSAQLVERWGDAQQGCYRYRGKHSAGRRATGEDQYIKLQRAAEDADFRRYCKAISVSEADCPY